MNHKIRKFEAGGKVATDDIIDPDEVMLGEDGNPLEDGNEDDVIIPPGGEEEEEEEEDEAEDSKDKDPEAKKDEGKHVNHADYVLKSLGYATDQIDLGEGVIKNVADLTTEEQLEVVTGRLEEVVGFYNTKLEEIEKNGGSFSNEVESVLIKALRDTDYNLSDLTKIISENDPATLAKTASNEDLVRGHLKKVYPGFTDEEITDELESMAGSSRFDKLASNLRETMIGQKIEGGDLAKAIQEFQSERATKEAAEFTENVTGIKTYIAGLKDFNGIPVSEEIKNFMIADLTTDSPDKDSAFIQNLNTPEKLFRLNFLDKFYDQLIDQTANYYFELGKAEGDKVAKKFKSTPDVIVTGGSRFKSSQAQEKPKAEETEEF